MEGVVTVLCVLGVGLLQKCAPELCVVSGVEEHQVVPHTWESVIHHDIQPLVMLPELQKKDSLNRTATKSKVADVKTLLGWLSNDIMIGIFIIL